MPNYVVLGKWTDQGIRNVKDSPKRGEAARALIEKLGGKMDLFYTMGEYDFAAFAEAPDDETVLQTLLQIGSQGNVRTTTLKAWPVLDAAKVISKLE